MRRPIAAAFAALLALSACERPNLESTEGGYEPLETVRGTTAPGPGEPETAAPAGTPGPVDTAPADTAPAGTPAGH